MRPKIISQCFRFFTEGKKVKRFKSKMSFPTIPRRSATLILAARNGSSSGYEVLLLQRSSASRFMPNRIVFPGGASEPTDFSNEWLELISNEDSTVVDSLKNAPFYSSYKSEVADGLPPHIGFRICAIRETFEESGVLLVKPLVRSKTGEKVLPFCANELAKWRNKVHSDPSYFIQLCRTINCAPDIWSLYEWVNWITPVQRKIRFNAMFYFAFLDEKPEMSHDGKELVYSLWIDPVESFQLCSEGKLSLGPPQLVEISRLQRFTDFNKLKKVVLSVNGVEEIEPVIIVSENGDTIQLLPDDSLYEVMKTRSYNYFKKLFKKTNFKNLKSIPVYQLDETTEELLRSSRQNICRVITDITTGNILVKMENNFTTMKHNLPAFPTKTLQIRTSNSKL